MIKIFQTLISKFFNAFLQAFLNHLVDRVGVTATAVVAMANDLNADKSLSGSAKAKKLASQLRTLAVSTGKEIPDSLINLIVETAVSILKSGAR